MRIDCDAHVDECEDTWSFMTESEAGFKPATVKVEGRRMWLWPGRTRVRHERSDEKTGTTEARRTLRDLDGRLRDMDKLGIDVQVIYPTFFLTTCSTRPDIELALTRSYNRWMADATERAKGRLRWVVILPWLSPEKALAEMKWAKDHGACGVSKMGTEHNRGASDPYFFPMYEEASRLNMPICMHAGSGDPTQTSPVAARLHTISACVDLIGGGVPERFPDLRVGWIECSASWIPFMWQDMVAREQKQNWGSGIRNVEARAENSLKIDKNLFRRFRFYSSTETTDDLPYILKLGLEDNLLLGTDYTHSDQSAVLNVHQIIEQRGEDGIISKEVARKLSETNAQRFYGL